MSVITFLCALLVLCSLVAAALDLLPATPRQDENREKELLDVIQSHPALTPLPPSQILPYGSQSSFVESVGSSSSHYATPLQQRG
ncbi:hypothetical protein Plhal710r2_c024g0098231 [Plasmopara halstedii]